MRLPILAVLLLLTASPKIILAEEPVLQPISVCIPFPDPTPLDTFRSELDITGIQLKVSADEFLDQSKYEIITIPRSLHEVPHNVLYYLRAHQAEVTTPIHRHLFVEKGVRSLIDFGPTIFGSLSKRICVGKGYVEKDAEGVVRGFISRYSFTKSRSIEGLDLNLDVLFGPGRIIG